MDRFLILTQAQQVNALRAAADHLGVAAEVVEKDLWVCWLLRELFRLPLTAPSLSFKGGTSLSKCWDLIARFSEDIDLVIDRERLGFGSESGPDAATTSNEQRRRVRKLREACRRFVLERVRADLAAALADALPDGLDWRLIEDPDGGGEPTLLFEYPLRVTGPMYLRREVRLEFGARSDVGAAECRSVMPYIASVAGLDLGECSFPVRVVAAERTFWEKVMLIHEELHRAARPRARLSRHYYDIACLADAGVATRAVSDSALGSAVAAHRRAFFPRAKAVHESLRPGFLRLVPPAQALAGWRADFAAMRDSMFIGPPPKFDDIMATVARVEAQVNAAAWR